MTITLSTTSSNDLIIVDVINTQSSIHGTITVSGSTLGSFTQRAEVDNGSTNTACWRFYKVAASPLSSEIITVSSTISQYLDAVAYGVSGANTVSPWQVASVTGTTEPQSITTSDAAFVTANIVINGSVTTDTGWTAPTPNVSFGLWEYRIPTGAGTFTVSAAGATTQNVILDAIAPAAGGGPTLFLRTLMGEGV